MLNMTSLSLDSCLRSIRPEHVAVTSIDPDTSDNRQAAEGANLEKIISLLTTLNLASENGFTIVIDVQGSTEAGRIIQAAVIDAAEGPREVFGAVVAPATEHRRRLRREFDISAIETITYGDKFAQYAREYNGDRPEKPYTAFILDTVTGEIWATATPFFNKPWTNYYHIDG